MDANAAAMMVVTRPRVIMLRPGMNLPVTWKGKESQAKPKSLARDMQPFAQATYAKVGVGTSVTLVGSRNIPST